MKKTLFSKIISLIIIAFICFGMTIGISLIFGSVETTIFDFQNLNFSNVIPVLIIGSIISCVIIVIAILFISKEVFLKAKSVLENYETKENGGNKK